MTLDILAMLRKIQQKLCDMNLAHEMTDYCANDLYAIESQITALISQIEKAKPIGFVAVDRHVPAERQNLIGGEILPMDEAADFHPECVVRVFSHPATIPENIDEIALRVAKGMAYEEHLYLQKRYGYEIEFARRLAEELLGEKK